MSLNTVSAGGAASATFETVSAGNVLVDNVAAGGNITVTSFGTINELNGDLSADMAATTGTISLTAGLGIGTSGVVEMDANNLTAVVTGNGAINLTDTSGAGTTLTIDTATTTNGAINIAASGGSIRANNVAAGGANGSVTLTTNTQGNILVDDISATGSVTLTSAQSVTEAGVDPGNDIIAGTSSTIIANPGVISTGDALEVQITTGLLSVLAGGQVSGASIRLVGTVAGSMSPTGTLIHLNTPPGTSTFNGISF